MPKEIFPSSYECDCGHQLHFCENTIREMIQDSYRKRAAIGEGDDEHAVIFHKGEMVAIYCPKRKEEIPAVPAMPKPPPPVLEAGPRYTPRQGQVLAFIYLYTKLNRRSPAEADIAQYFGMSPPSVHQMVVTLTRKGLIERQPWVARSITLHIDPKDLPTLK